MTLNNFFYNKMQGHVLYFKMNTFWRLEYFMIILRQYKLRVITQKYYE